MEGSWNPRDYLEEVSYEKARLSTGFLQAELDKFFPKLIELWKPLFLSLGIKEPSISCQQLLEHHSIKSNAAFLAGYEVNSAQGFITIDSESLQTISNVVTANKNFNTSVDILMSYLMRRFLVSLEKTWAGNKKLKVSYLDSIRGSVSEIAARVKIKIELNSKTAIINFGIPLNLVEIINQAALEIGKTSLSEKTKLAVELFGIQVPPDALLDYLRSGTIIKTANEFSDEVSLYVNGRPWAQGILKTCQDKFAVEVTNLIAPRADISSGNTRISAQLDGILVEQDLKTYKSLGSIILTNLRLNSPLSLYVSGEKIGIASMRIDQDNHATIKLLSKY